MPAWPAERLGSRRPRSGERRPTMRPSERSGTNPDMRNLKRIVDPTHGPVWDLRRVRAGPSWNKIYRAHFRFQDPLDGDTAEPPTPPGKAVPHPHAKLLALVAPPSKCGAAGAPAREARARAFLELRGPHASRIRGSNRSRRPRSDPTQLSSASVRNCRGRHNELGRRFWMLDISSDLHVPVVV